MRAGDRKTAEILAFPALKSIPEPELPLKEIAYDKYRELATAFFNAKKLNSFTRLKIEQFAIMHENLHKRIVQGFTISTSSMDAMTKLMKELQLVDESQSTAPPEGGKENRYSRIGAIVRPGAKKAELRPS